MGIAIEGRRELHIVDMLLHGGDSEVNQVVVLEKGREEEELRSEFAIVLGVLIHIGGAQLERVEDAIRYFHLRVEADGSSRKWLQSKEILKDDHFAGIG